MKNRIPASPDPAETLFLQSFEELAGSNSSPARETLHKNFPGSIWTKNADILAELYSSHRQSLQREGELKKNWHACKKAGRKDRNQIEQLMNDLQSMKDLVIEMELRSK